MPYKIPQSKVEQQLTKEVAQKLLELQQAQHEQERLMYQADVLEHIVHLMGSLKQVHGDQDDLEMLLDTPSNHGIEQQLLEQLDDMTCVPSCTSMAVSYAAAAQAEQAAARLSSGQPPPFGPALRNSSFSSTCGSIPTSSDDQQATTAAAAATTNAGGGSCSHRAAYVSTLLGEPSGTADALQQQAMLHQAIAPDGDHLHVFRHLISLPPYNGAESMTLQQMQQDYQHLICELTLNVALLEDPQLQGSCCVEQPLQAIATLVTHHLHLLTTLLQQHRGDLLQAFYLSDCLSGQVGDQRQLQIVSTAVGQVELREQQRQEVAHIMAVFQRLLNPLVAARQQLQTYGISGDDGSSSSSSSSTSDSSSGSLDGQEGSSAASAVDQEPRMLPSLLQQQARVSGLSMVMRKEMFLKACCFGIAIGRLEWLQVARLMLAIFPFPMAMSVVGQEISRQFEEDQQQILRQQQQRRVQALVRAMQKGRRRYKKRAH